MIWNEREIIIEKENVGMIRKERERKQNEKERGKGNIL